MMSDHSFYIFSSHEYWKLNILDFCFTVLLILKDIS